jgi:hypothetical protein
MKNPPIKNYGDRIEIVNRAVLNDQNADDIGLNAQEIMLKKQYNELIGNQQQKHERELVHDHEPRTHDGMMFNSQLMNGNVNTQLKPGIRSRTPQAPQAQLDGAEEGEFPIVVSSDIVPGGTTEVYVQMFNVNTRQYYWKVIICWDETLLAFNRRKIFDLNYDQKVKEKNFTLINTWNWSKYNDKWFMPINEVAFPGDIVRGTTNETPKIKRSTGNSVEPLHSTARLSNQENINPVYQNNALENALIESTTEMTAREAMSKFYDGSVVIKMHGESLGANLRDNQKPIENFPEMSQPYVNQATFSGREGNGRRASFAEWSKSFEMLLKGCNILKARWKPFMAMKMTGNAKTHMDNIMTQANYEKLSYEDVRALFYRKYDNEHDRVAARQELDSRKYRGPDVESPSEYWAILKSLAVRALGIGCTVQTVEEDCRPLFMRGLPRELGICAAESPLGIGRLEPVDDCWVTKLEN